MTLFLIGFLSASVLWGSYLVWVEHRTHLETLLAAATPGPWYSDGYARVWDSQKMDLCCMEATFDPPDISLIVALRNAAPALIARVRELENPQIATVVDDKTVADMIKAEPTPEEIEWTKRVVSDPPIPYPPKEWEVEAAAAMADTYPHIPLPDEKRMLEAHKILHRHYYTVNNPGMHMVTPEEHPQPDEQAVQAAVKGYKDAIAILNGPSKPEIDWEKVARSRLTSLVWEALPDHWQHGEIEAAKAAVAEYLRQAGKEEEWQPIETAPKDGTVIDLWVPASTIYKAHRFHSAKWDEAKGWVMDKINVRVFEIVETATHWKHLPKPPESNAQ